MHLSMRRWHRRLGLGLGWLMLIWFLSGGVMMYAHLPRQYKSAEGRLARAPALAAPDLRLDFTEAWRRAGCPGNLAEVRLVSIAGRPAFVFRPEQGEYRLVWADTGQAAAGVGPDLARRSAQGVLPAKAPLHYLGLADYDQWTVGASVSDAYRPLHKFAAGDQDRTEIYVSARTGEVCQLTTAGSRFWSWLGAIPHWLYFTVLRRHLELWHWTIIVLAAVGCLLCLSGLWVGIKHFRLSGWGKGRHHRLSAFTGLRKWHHYLGLVFGIPALAWTFSGMMSMEPFDWCTPAIPDSTIAAALAGGPPRPGECRQRPAQVVTRLGPEFSVKMLRLISFQGRPYLLALDGEGKSRLLPAWRPEAPAEQSLTTKELTAAAQNLLPGHEPCQMDLLARGGLYLPGWSRPVLRLVYDDPAETWLYLDPARAEMVRRLDRNRRLNRWLYKFLHCLDLPWLLRHDLLREVLMLALLAGGTLLCLTGPWSWLARRRRRQ